MSRPPSTPPPPIHHETWGDLRLGPAVAILDNNDIEVLTLDVFDTALWRTVPEPVDAFPLLGASLVECGPVRPHVAPASFANVRQAAERQARRLHPDPEVPE